MTSLYVNDLERDLNWIIYHLFYYWPKYGLDYVELLIIFFKSLRATSKSCVFHIACALVKYILHRKEICIFPHYYSYIKCIECKILLFNLFQHWLMVVFLRTIIIGKNEVKLYISN